jgi:cell division protease FtsH
MVMQLPEKDQHSYSREKMHSKLAILMAGRLAEEIIFGYDNVPSGASSDIQAATNLARSMVKEWGMSDAVGPLHMNTDVDVYGRQASLSERMQNLVDDEVSRFVQEADDKARKILNDKIDDLHKIAKAMIEYETLSGQDIDDLVAGKEINRINIDDEDAYVPPAGAVPQSDEDQKSKKSDDKNPSDGDDKSSD